MCDWDKPYTIKGNNCEFVLKLCILGKLFLSHLCVRNDISNTLPLPNDSALIVQQFLIQPLNIIQQLYFAQKYNKVQLMFYFRL